MAEGITLGAAYLRIWNKAVLAEKVDGRWRVYAKPSLQNKQEAVSA
jgi:hypothetical protein